MKIKCTYPWGIAESRFCSNARLVSWMQFLRALASKFWMELFSKKRCFSSFIPASCWKVTSWISFCLQSSFSSLEVNLAGSIRSWFPASSHTDRLGRRRPPSTDTSLLELTERVMRLCSWVMSRFLSDRIWFLSKFRWTRDRGRLWGTLERRFEDKSNVFRSCSEEKNVDEMEEILLLPMLSRLRKSNLGVPCIDSIWFPSR